MYHKDTANTGESCFLSLFNVARNDKCWVSPFAQNQTSLSLFTRPDQKNQKPIHPYLIVMWREMGIMNIQSKF